MFPGTAGWPLRCLLCALRGGGATDGEPMRQQEPEGRSSIRDLASSVWLAGIRGGVRSP